MAAASLLKIKRPSSAVSVQELGSLRRTCFVRILPLSLTRPRSMAGDHGVATSAQPTLSPTSPPSGSKQVLISLSNKTNLEVLGRSLIDLGYTIVSTGGTAETLEKADIAVRKVEELTAFPEMLDGHVKTLHPTIHGGILARRDFHTHMGALKEWNIGGHRYSWKEGCFFGLPWHQKMSRSLSTVKAPLLSPPSTEGKEQPVPSPLTMVPSPSDSTKKSSAEIDRKRPVQAVLKKIKESPKKVNLVAALVRGMRVEDALLQLAVLQKRAAKTVKRVVSNARANATHNHGLNGDRLFVAEAFVGKGKYLKRLSYHAKGRSGIMHHPSCRLTVIVKELSDEQEAEIARYKTMTFRERAKVKTRLIPHKLIETMPRWHRTSQQSSGVLEA